MQYPSSSKPKLIFGDVLFMTRGVHFMSLLVLSSSAGTREDLRHGRRSSVAALASNSAFFLSLNLLLVKHYTLLCHIDIATEAD